MQRIKTDWLLLLCKDNRRQKLKGIFISRKRIAFVIWSVYNFTVYLSLILMNYFPPIFLFKILIYFY